MHNRKSFFRSAFDAMIEARTREAERMLAYYHINPDLETAKAQKRQ